MSNFLSFSTKNNYLGLFGCVWVKADFPLESSFNDSMQIIIQSNQKSVNLWITKNKDMSSANNFTFDDRPSARSLI